VIHSTICILNQNNNHICEPTEAAAGSLLNTLTVTAKSYFAFTTQIYVALKEELAVHTNCQMPQMLLNTYQVN
jgi:hypothetical protein